MTVLMVDDSRFACDSLRLMCMASGARIRRADSLAAARRHLESYRPRVVVVDLGLPDGSGLELIAELSRAPEAPLLLAISGESRGREACAAGAAAFLEKPLRSLAAFQRAILDNLPAEETVVPGPRDTPITPDPLALLDDLQHAATLLAEEDASAERISYVAQFVFGLAQLVQDADLARACQGLRRAVGTPVQGARTQQLHGLLTRRRMQGIPA